jgi:Phasin protein
MPDGPRTTTKTASQTAPKTASGVKEWGANFEPLFAMNRSAFEVWAHGMSRVSHEMAQFMQSRLLEDSVMWETLATCRDPADAIECQRRFGSKATTDYSEAAQKFSRLMMDIAGSYGSGLRRTPTETD